jgi:hypothetical protein
MSLLCILMNTLCCTLFLQTVQAGDDAGEVEVLSLSQALKLALKGPLTEAQQQSEAHARDSLWFDHSAIILDYMIHTGRYQPV